MKNLKKKANYVILTFILVSYIFSPLIEIPITRTSNLVSDKTEEKGNLFINNDFSHIITPPSRFATNDWNKEFLSFDKNGNGINDNFDLKLYTLEESVSLVESDSNDQISFIIQFPDNYDYSTVISIFKSYGGTIKYTYKEAINGFAGSIEYDGFVTFSDQLKQENIKFLIEENGKAKSNLYYNSRNMNLRPYVWKELGGGYTGDNTSSIAIVDSGIDESHDCFSDSYGDGDFTKKIVGWADFTFGGDNGTVTDYNGHGSHCAGIAAGVGTTVLDGLGRVITSPNAKYDLYPYAFDDGDIIGFKSATFNVTSQGQIEAECNYKDLILGGDRAWGSAYLVKEDSVLNWTGFTNVNWLDNITYNVQSNELGIYELWLVIEFVDVSGDSLIIWPEFAFRGEIHWYFNPDTFDCGNRFKGVAPDTHLVGVRVLDEGGAGDWADIIRGVEWVIANREIYNITVMSMSLGPSVPGFSLQALIVAVDKAVENGIVTVVSAGNDGAGGDYIGSPADADNVITVAAMNHNDQITYYSSQGGPSNSTETKKPDIMAPGGSANSLMTLSADTNDNDCEGEFPVDDYNDDLLPAQGTSMACPSVAGAANLLIQAMGGGNNWNWNDGTKSKLVKAILLMTATETYPLQREDDESSSPPLNRGGKDVHEGYGRINVDAAIEAWLNESIPSGTTFTMKPILNSSRINPFGRHAYARHVYLTTGKEYTFNLTVPSGVDYDLYLYNSTPAKYGEPDLIASSTSGVLGKDEIFNFTAKYDGKYFLIAKAIGQPYPSSDDDDDDDKSTAFTIDLLPILIIIGIIALLAIVFVIILYKKGRKDDIYDFKPEY